jgi:hypothetical protein
VSLLHRRLAAAGQPAREEPLSEDIPFFNRIWRFPKIKVPNNEWFIKENPSVNGWFRDTPMLGNLHMSSNYWRSSTKKKWDMGINQPQSESVTNE